VLVSIRDRTDVVQATQSSSIVAGISTWACNSYSNYRDRSRMLARHEALVDLSFSTDVEIATLPLVSASAITKCKTDEGYIRWRIG
jgi:hypothetical protein